MTNYRPEHSTWFCSWSRTIYTTIDNRLFRLITESRMFKMKMSFFCFFSLQISFSVIQSISVKYTNLYNFDQIEFLNNILFLFSYLIIEFISWVYYKYSYNSATKLECYKLLLLVYIKAFITFSIIHRFDDRDFIFFDIIISL